MSSIDNDHGKIGVLAIDHRDSLRMVIDPEDPGAVSPDSIVELKRVIIEELAGSATGVMLEPEYSIPALVECLPEGCGFTAALESQGYSADPTTVLTTILDGWSVPQAKASGAAMAKLLVYLSGDAPQHAASQLETVRRVVDECRSIELPLVIEPLAFPGAVERDRLRAVEMTLPLGADLMKVAWPGSEQLQELASLLCDRRWVVLSAGVGFEEYLDQVGQCIELGASGFMAGRAVWREVTTVAFSERRELLRDVALPRLNELSALLS